jgi:hypothetical protein
VSRVVLGVFIWLLGMGALFGAILTIEPGWALFGVMLGSVVILVSGTTGECRVPSTRCGRCTTWPST